MMDEKTKELQTGWVVRLTDPADQRERDARFVVRELRGERVLIQLICDLRIPPMGAVLMTDVTPA